MQRDDIAGTDIPGLPPRRPIIGTLASLTVDGQPIDLDALHAVADALDARGMPADAGITLHAFFEPERSASLHRKFALLGIGSRKLLRRFRITSALNRV